jgi:hypothetical protein
LNELVKVVEVFKASIQAKVAKLDRYMKTVLITSFIKTRYLKAAKRLGASLESRNHSALR